jgi:hypothetical protein
MENWNVIVTAAGAVLVTVVTGVTTVWAGRRRGMADIQTVITQGFSELVDTMREQLKIQNERIEELEKSASNQRHALVVLRRYILDKGLELPEVKRDD